MFEGIRLGSLVYAALAGSGAALVATYFLLPAFGLPRLAFADIAAGWFGVKGKGSQFTSALLFLAGGLFWTYLYARFSPRHSAFAGMLFGVVPFLFSSLTAMRQADKFRVLSMPGFVWRLGGPQATLANLIEHLAFGFVIGLVYSPK